MDGLGQCCGFISHATNSYTLHYTATLLQHSATHCNTLQHTATHLLPIAERRHHFEGLRQLPGFISCQQLAHALIYLSKEPCILSKETLSLCKESSVLSKEPNFAHIYLSKEPCTLSKEPCNLSKDRHILWKDPCVLSKKPRHALTYQKSPSPSKKSSVFFRKIPIIYGRSPVVCPKSSVTLKHTG